MTAWLGFVIAFGPLVLMAAWMALLNGRDRRRDAIEATVGACCAGLGLRGAFAVHVRVGALSGAIRVVLDMRLCTTGEVWQVVDRLPPRLPRRASLRIVAAGPRHRPRTLALERAVVAVL